MFQKCGQPPIIGIRKEPKPIEQELQAAEHGPTGDHRHGPDRKTLMARRLAARRIDQAKLGIVPNLAILPFIPLRNQQAGKDAGVAQQPLETLMRRRLPAVEGVPGIGIDTWRLDAHEKLPAAISLPEFGDSPGGPKCRAMFRQRDKQFIGNGRAARRAGDMARFPAKHLFDEGPGIGEGRPGKLRADNLANLASVDRRLPERQKPQFLEEGRRDDEAHRRHMVEPFEIGIAIDFAAIALTPIPARDRRGRRAPGGALAPHRSCEAASARRATHAQGASGGLPNVAGPPLARAVPRARDRG